MPLKKKLVKDDFSNEIYAYALENALLYGSARASNILPKLFLHGLKKDKIKEVMPTIEGIVNLVNAMTYEEREKKFDNYKKFQKEKSSDERKELPDLPGIAEFLKKKKKPIFRMAPFPSGALHIGNMKTYLLNALYAERYNGKILLIMDDTIGSEEKRIDLQAYNLIKEGFDFLKVKYEKPIIFKSDRVKIYYKYAEDLIKKKKAYVDFTPVEKMRELRARGIPSASRELPVKFQMDNWKKMFLMPEGSAVLRLKTDMKHKNPAFRDRVIFRISDREHPRVGKKYRVWPLLEFSWAVDDYLLGVTHIIRGKELMMEGEVQRFIWKIFGWKQPEIIYVGLIKIEGISGKLSKSKSQKEIYSGEYIGWDDPRTWSIQSLARRGILSKTLRDFVKKIGLNQKEISIPIDDLYAINRRYIDKKANRYFFVENPVKISLDKKLPNLIKVKFHPEKKDEKVINTGEKNEIFITKKDFEDFKGKEVRLMHVFNVKLDKESIFTSEENKPELKKIHWVCDEIKSRVLMPDGVWINGFVEKNALDLDKGEIIQFERFGFCRFDGKNRFDGVLEFWYSHR
ncbi:MAG: glutamate--tRNA ligase [Candidatus Pacearchaeota archaeon]